MDTIRPDLLDEWIAYYRIEPFGSEWRQSAQIAYGIAQLRAAEIARGGVTPDEVVFDQYMPLDSDNAGSTSSNVLSLEQTEKSLAGLAGF